MLPRGQKYMLDVNVQLFAKFASRIAALWNVFNCSDSLIRSASKIGSSTSIVAVMQTRSRKVEMPNGLSLPLAFGINTLLMGSGR